MPAPSPYLQRGWQALWLSAAAVLLLVAAAFPQSDVVAWQVARSRHVSDPRGFHAAVIGLRLLLVVDAVLLIRWAHLRSAQRRSEPAGMRPLLAWRREALALAPVLAVAACLRFWRLDADLWLDEIATAINFARSDLAACLTTFPSANHHPLNSLLVRLSVEAFGESNWSIRLSAAVFGVAGIGAMYFLARTVTETREALLATVLLACSYHHVYYSQSARGYSGYLLGTILGTAFFIRLLRHHRRSDAIGYVLAMLLAFTCHPNTLFVWAAQAIVLFVAWRFAARVMRAGWDVAGAMALVALGTLQFYALMLPEMLGYFRNVDTAGVGFQVLSSLFWQAFARGMQLGPAGLAAVLALVAVVGLGLVSYLRQNRLTGMSLVLPLNLGLITAVALNAPIYPRYFLFGLPVGLLLVVRGIRVATDFATVWIADCSRRTIWSRRAGVLLSAAALAAVALPLVNYYRVPKQPYTQALQFISDSKTEQARVVAVDLAAHGCRYYQPDTEAAQTLAELRTLEATADELWVLYSFPASLTIRHPDLAAHLSKEYQAIRSFPAIVGDGAIHVCRLFPTVATAQSPRWPPAGTDTDQRTYKSPCSILGHLSEQ